MFLPVRDSKAFTLLELIVVIVILGILAAIAIPSFQKVIVKSQDSSAVQTLEAIDREARALAAFRGESTPTSDDYAEATSDLPPVAAAAGTYAARGWKLKVPAATPTTGTYEHVETYTTSAVLERGEVHLGYDAGGTVSGLSTVSESGNCVLLQSKDGGVETFTRGDLGANCTGTLAVEGPDAASPTYSSGVFAPGAPTAVSVAHLGDSSAAVSFTPGDTGNGVVTYTVSVSPAATGSSGSSSPLTVSGLALGTTYSVTVKAVNSAGEATSTSASYVHELPAGKSLWAASYGASATSALVFSVAAGPDGSSYVSGRYSGTITTHNGTSTSDSTDAYVAKYSASGALQWMVTGGTGPGMYNPLEEANGIAADSSGVYVYGTYAGNQPASGYTGFLAGLPADYNNGLFLVKLDPATGAVVWQRKAGGSGNDYATSVALRGGDLYVAGNFNSSALDGFATGAALTPSGVTDAFAARVSAVDGSPVWAVTTGGTSYDGAREVAVNDTTVFVSGYFNSAEITSGFASGSGANVGGTDAFVAALSRTDGSRIWARATGGTGSEDDVRQLSATADGLYATGVFRQAQTGFLSPLPTPSVQSAFMVRLNPANGSTVWVRQGAGSTGANGYGVAATGSDLYFTGDYSGTAAPAGFLAGAKPATAGWDTYVVKANPADGSVMWVVRAGGASTQPRTGLAAGPSAVFLSGSYSGTTPTLFGSPLPSSSGGSHFLGAVER